MTLAAIAIRTALHLLPDSMPSQLPALRPASTHPVDALRSM
jgi:hypothetical protein